MAKKRIYKLKDVIKQKFNYDVSDLEAYVDEQSTEILTDLVYSSKLISRINVMENVKGSEKIKLMSADLALQSADTCERTPDGAVVFTDKTMTTVRVKQEADFCNEDLTTTWAQMLLAIGANRQDRELPLDAVITKYSITRGQFKNQNLMFRGDTTSLNPDLVHYDGFVKMWNADVLIPEVDAPYAAVTDLNGFKIAKLMTNSIDGVVINNGVPTEVIGAREDLQAIVDNIYYEKDYNALINVDDTDGELNFKLPTTNVTFRSYPQLLPGEMYVALYGYMFFGTDLENDFDGFVAYYSEETGKLYFGVKWRSGVQYVYPEYFRKLNLVGS